MKTYAYRAEILEIGGNIIQFQDQDGNRLRAIVEKGGISEDLWKAFRSLEVPVFTEKIFRSYKVSCPIRVNGIYNRLRRRQFIEIRREDNNLHVLTLKFDSYKIFYLMRCMKIAFSKKGNKNVERNEFERVVVSAAPGRTHDSGQGRGASDGEPAAGQGGRDECGREGKVIPQFNSFEEELKWFASQEEENKMSETSIVLGEEEDDDEDFEDDDEDEAEIVVHVGGSSIDPWHGILDRNNPPTLEELRANSIPVTDIEEAIR